MQTFNRKKLSIAVGIATAGRRDVLTEGLKRLTTQTVEPDVILVCPADANDVDLKSINTAGIKIEVINGKKGSSSQRNAIMDASNADIIVFFDDDFLPSDNYLEEVMNIFTSNPDIVAATGKVISDGILGPGLTFSEAEAIISNNSGAGDSLLTDINNVYGCNMIVRMSTVRETRTRFDENLPLYGWLEDVDFSRQLSVYGRVVRASQLRGVHLGTKLSGRSPGRRLGYSQVANPIYLASKGTMTWKGAMRQILRNLAANAAGSIKPEPWVDRRGRLYGNLYAIKELCSGRISPLRILDMK